MSPIEPTQHGATLIHPHGLRDTRNFYHHVATGSPSSVIVTTAGQVGVDLNGVVPRDPAEQIQLAFQNLRRCLDAAGASTEDIVKLTYYVVNYDAANPQHRGPLLEFLGEHRPPATLVPVPALASPQYIFEVEAIVAVPQATPRVVDVVVIGAGLSGLQAACNIQTAGLSCVVLEARDRVGGKTWSKPANGGVADVGAAWINDTNQSRMFALAQRFGLDLVTQNTVGNMIVEDLAGKCNIHPYGTLVPTIENKGVLDDMIRIRDWIEEICQKVNVNDPISSTELPAKDLESMTLEQLIRRESYVHDTLGSVKIWTRAMLGVEPSELSALYFLHYCKSGGGLMQMRSDKKDGGQYLRVMQGTQSFSKCLAGQLAPASVVLRSPVRHIQQQDDGVHVTTARGQYRCRRVIVSVPTPLYKEIMFEPPLPSAKIELSESTKLGSYCKMILVYQKPWWRDVGLCGLSISPNGPYAATRDTSVDATGHYSLTCFVTGQPAREWAKLSTQSRRRAILEQVSRVFGVATKAEEPIEVLEQIWADEQWSQGCPCPVMPPGVLTELGHTLRAPFGRLHFIGTETADDGWRGYMEGAVRSGERGAEEVLHHFGSSKL